VQAFIPEAGKGIQGATSHALGQNFSKMFDIKFMDDKKAEQYVWQTSWGCTTRTLGVMVMTHGDDKGLVVPPRIAAKHAVIVPITMANQSAEERAAMEAKATELAATLTKAGAIPLRPHLCTVLHVRIARNAACEPAQQLGSSLHAWPVRKAFISPKHMMALFTTSAPEANRNSGTSAAQASRRTRTCATSIRPATSTRTGSSGASACASSSGRRT
jgi:hypothetical protein